MEPLGYVTVPRRAGLPASPPGAFFSAAVEGQMGPNTWKVNLAGQTVVVTTSLPLAPGEVLRLKLIDQTGARAVFQIVTTPNAPEWTPLMAAFLSRGLPLAQEKLSVWARWMKSGASDQDSWAASLEARGQGPHSALADTTQPWLNWLAALEQGRSEPPPEGEWDEWNLRTTAGGDPWLVVPLHWEHADGTDHGLLQAHYQPASGSIDLWNVTASPSETPFRLEARAGADRLDLIWRFFRPEQRRLWEERARGFGEVLSSPGLAVTLTVKGPARAAARVGVDVQA